MNISVSEASKRWGVSRTTIYKKIDDGELSRNSDKKIDTAEMLRVFGNPPNTERTEQTDKNVQKTPVNSEYVQENVQLKHQLEIEKLKNIHLEQRVDHYKDLVENYQKQIEQLSKSLDKANASIQDFAQTKLLELKHNLPSGKEEDKDDLLKEDNTIVEVDSRETSSKSKKNWWRW